MLEEQIKKFITKQLDDLDDFIYTLEEEDLYCYVIFSQILGENINKEMTFKMIDNKLYYHSINYGWKILSRETNNKYFWIDLITKE